VKRRILFGIVPALSVAFLIGCGGGFPTTSTGGPTPGPGGPTPAPTPTPAPGEGGRLDLSGGAPLGTIYFATNYGRTATDFKSQLYASRADGSGRTLIAEGATGTGSTGLSFTALSPDGKNLVFQTTGVGFTNQSAILAKADGTGRRTFVSGGYARDLAFTPDGQKMVYVQQSPSGDSQSVVIENLDGSGKRTISTGTFASNTLGAFGLMPSGSKVVASGDAGLFVENLDGSGRVSLAGTELTTVGSPAFSPDGAKVAAYLQHKTDTTKNGIYVLSANGSASTLVLSQSGFGLTDSSGFGLHPDTAALEGWSPGGQLLFSVARRTGGI
jgi:Tol biopolymer transport system component